MPEALPRFCEFRIRSRDAASSEEVAVFKVPGEILSESRVESYTLRVTDSYSRPTEPEAILLREYGDDEPVEKNADSA